MIFAKGYFFGSVEKCRGKDNKTVSQNMEIFFLCSFLYTGDDEDYNSDSSGDGEYSQAALPSVSFSSISDTYHTIGGFTNYLLASTVNSKRDPHSFHSLLPLAPRAALLHKKPVRCC
jgi:hypothetical protein